MGMGSIFESLLSGFLSPSIWLDYTSILCTLSRQEAGVRPRTMQHIHSPIPDGAMKG